MNRSGLEVLSIRSAGLLSNIKEQYKHHCSCNAMLVSRARSYQAPVIEEPLWSRPEDITKGEPSTILWRRFQANVIFDMQNCLPNLTSYSLNCLPLNWISWWIHHTENIHSLRSPCKNFCADDQKPIFSKYTGYIRQEANPIFTAQLKPYALNYENMLGSVWGQHGSRGEQILILASKFTSMVLLAIAASKQWANRCRSSSKLTGFPSMCLMKYSYIMRLKENPFRMFGFPTVS